jgi:ABC-type spermidine/putrescine transport system permease subunit I
MTSRNRLPSSQEWTLYLFLAPLTLLMAVYYLIPLFNTVVNSFHPFSGSGIDTSSWTIQHYVRLLDPFYASVFLRTLRVSLIVCLVTCALAYPVAWRISKASGRAQAALILVFMSPLAHQRCG